ncbi:hypothetical protein TNCV_4408941 [Trichonephila clavipes]|nr:hypothetical protein TNCV_4408941 [Trichonephila clavipes]
MTRYADNPKYDALKPNSNWHQQHLTAIFRLELDSLKFKQHLLFTCYGCFTERGSQFTDNPIQVFFLHGVYGHRSTIPSNIMEWHINSHPMLREPANEPQPSAFCNLEACHISLKC